MTSRIQTSKILEPPVFHREYENDLGKSKPASPKALDQCLRVAQVALPFIALYKPLSKPLSIALGTVRVISSTSYLMEVIKSGDKSNAKYALLQTTIAVVALASEVFAHPVGMLITTGQDLIINANQLVAALKENDRKGYKKALEICAHILNNSLHLALFFTGALEILAASFAVQILLGLYQSSSEFNKGNYLEGSAHLLMAGIRTNQLKTQIGAIKMKWEIESFLQKINGDNSQQVKILPKSGYAIITNKKEWKLYSAQDYKYKWKDHKYKSDEGYPMIYGTDIVSINDNFGTIKSGSTKLQFIYCENKHWTEFSTTSWTKLPKEDWSKITEEQNEACFKQGKNFLEGSAHINKYAFEKIAFVKESNFPSLQGNFVGNSIKGVFRLYMLYHHNVDNITDKHATSYLFVTQSGPYLDETLVDQHFDDVFSMVKPIVN